MGSSPIPVTITRLQGEGTPPCPEENTRQKFSKEFDNKMKRLVDDMADDFQAAETLLKAKQPLKVSERQQIAEVLRRIQQEIKSNVPFVQRQFNRSVDKTVTEAKGEIEAFLENKIRTLGLDAAREKGLLPEHAPIPSTGRPGNRTNPCDRH